MILFKNRYAEFDNLDDSRNENVLKNCYNKDYRRNFLSMVNRQYGHKKNPNKKNYNDIRAGNYIVNDYQRQNVFTPFSPLPAIQDNGIYNGNEQYQQQIINPSKSTPNLPPIQNYPINQVRTPLPRYPANYPINNDPNSSHDSIDQDPLNLSNQEILRHSLNRELEELEKERKFLLEKEKLNLIDFELRYLRQKMNADLQLRLAEQQQQIEYYNRLKEKALANRMNNQNNVNRRRINNYKINNFRYGSNSKPYNNPLLEETLKSNLMNDKLYMNDLIDRVNRMKLSQQEVNFEFQRKMKDLAKQNEYIQKDNQRMIEKIRDMKYALSEQKQNDINDYFYEPRNRIIEPKRLFEEESNTINNNNNDNNFNSKSFNRGNNYNNNNYNEDYNKKNFMSLNPQRGIDNYKHYYLGKKDKDVEEFNLLNKNYVNRNNKDVVTPSLFNKGNRNKYNRNYELELSNKNDNNNEEDMDICLDNKYKENRNYTLGNDLSETRKENLYSLIRKNNRRLEKIKEIEEKS